MAMGHMIKAHTIQAMLDQAFFLRKAATPHSRNPLQKKHSLLLCYEKSGVVIYLTTQLAFKTDTEVSQMEILSNYHQQLTRRILGG